MKKLGECEKTTNLGRIKNVRGWLDKMSRNRNGGRGDCVQTKGKKKGGVNQYAAAIRAGKAKKLCGFYLRDDDSGWVRRVQFGSPCLRQQKKKIIQDVLQFALNNEERRAFLSISEFACRSN